MTDPCEGKYDIVSRLRDHTNRDDNDIAEAAAYIERLRAERDEARREVCVAREALIRLMTHGNVAVPQEAMHQAAKARGWDCFEEVKP